MIDFPTRQRLIEAFRSLANRFGWRLLALPRLGATEQDIARIMQAQLEDWLRTEHHAAVDDALLSRAATAAYCVLLHQALGSPVADICDEALREIWAYILPIARRYLREEDLAQEVANRALEIIWEKRETVEIVPAFLSWCGTVMSREAWHELKRRRRDATRMISGDELDEDGDEDRWDRLSRHASIDQPMLSKSTRGDPPEPELSIDELEDLLRRCLGSEQQRAVLSELVLRDSDVVDVARQHGISENNVYALKRRARLRLQDCQQFLDALELSAREIARRRARAV